MRINLLMAIVLSLLVPACRDAQQPLATKPLLPSPTLEGNRSFTDTDSIYCMEWYPPPSGEPALAHEALLRALLREGIHLRNVWFPTAISPCAYIGAVSVVIAELDGPDPRIEKLGFLPEPMDWWAINCGIPSLWRYSFEP